MADPFRMTEENGQTTDGSTTTGHRVDDGKVRVADLGGYHVRDIEFVAAFDIDSEKVGKDLSEAIWAGQNDTIKFAEVPELGVKVERGMTHDGLGKYLKQKITKAPGETADIVRILRETKADVLVCYLPVGSEQATKWYVEQALNEGISGQLDGPSSYLMKSPHNQRPDNEARELTEQFIAAHARKAPGEPA